MLKLLFRALGGGIGLVLLAGCCANNPCDCQDLLADSLYFSFATTGPGAFSLSEIQNVYLARYDSTNQVVSRDSLPLPRNQRTPKTLRRRLGPLLHSDTTGLLILSNNAPFAATSSTGKLSNFTYRLYVPQDSAGTFKKRTFTTFTFDRLRIVGHYQADACCTCYENTFKRVRVSGGTFASGQVINATELHNDTTWVPMPIRLRK